MNIVIPTYGKHYKYNIAFLDSFESFCLDKQHVNINFIINSSEHDLFDDLKNKYKNLNINIIKLSELLYNVDKKEYPDEEQCFKTKYSLQSLKKLFSYTVVDTDYVVLDSENLCLKKFYFKDIFRTLKDKPIIYCNHVYNELQEIVIQNSNTILKTNINEWFFLKGYWFYERHHVKSLIESLKIQHKCDATQLLKDIIFFEYQLYCQFLFKNRTKEFTCIDNFIKKEFDFVKELRTVNHNYEYINTILNEKNIRFYINILNNLNERIVRLHWMDEKIRNQIINETNVCIGTFHWD